MAEEKELKECQLCHQMLPISSFYKRKDRNGDYNWIRSYCNSCDSLKVKESRGKKPALECLDKAEAYYDN